ncbi:hypothetical protein [Streptomyces sp. NPDC126933]|uniref:hypothetical protein n=1 Tax=unclassified Streptomyces TaxID=2593676 RepID=UPI00364B0C62
MTFDVAGASCITTGRGIFLKDYIATHWWPTQSGEPSTIERIEQRVRRHILPYLGAQQLNGVGTETLRNWKKRLADSHAIRAAPARSVRRLPHPAGSMRGRPSVCRPRGNGGTVPYSHFLPRAGARAQTHSAREVPRMPPRPCLTCVLAGQAGARYSSVRCPGTHRQSF